MDGIAPEYIAARQTLLDALQALEPHLDNLVLVGAQAVYFHIASDTVGLAMPLMTTDGDLAINVDGLSDDPEIATALETAGFTAEGNPGNWTAANGVVVDLMSVPHQSGRAGRNARGARLPRHSKKTARITRGLEPALVDNAMAELPSFKDDDTRSFELRVAGPAALVAAKLIKISERLNEEGRRPDRVNEKDALDVFRILQSVDTAVLVNGFSRHMRDDHAAVITGDALETLRERGTTPEGRIPQLAANAAQGDPTVALSFAILANELLTAMQRAELSKRLTA